MKFIIFILKKCWYITSIIWGNESKIVKHISSLYCRTSISCVASQHLNLKFRNTLVYYFYHIVFRFVTFYVFVKVPIYISKVLLLNKTNCKKKRDRTGENKIKTDISTWIQFSTFQNCVIHYIDSPHVG